MNRKTKLKVLAILIGFMLLLLALSVAGNIYWPGRLRGRMVATLIMAFIVFSIFLNMAIEKSLK